MSREGKATAKEKLRIVELYLAGKVGCIEASKISGVGETTIRRWVSRYKTEGPTGLLPKDHDRAYSKETKLSAVLDYLAGKGTLQEVCEQYGIRDTRQLRDWLKVYNRHEDFKIHTGGSRMTKGRDATAEERIQIVKECVSNGNDYGGTALKYQVSYQQVYTWTKKYREMGEAGLEDRRGHRAGTLPSRTPGEELRDRIAQLEREKYDLEMENALLKKSEGIREEATLSFVRYQSVYEAVRTLDEERSFPVWKLCDFLHITRSAYYRWLKPPKSNHELENERIAGEVEKIHKAHPDMGYRRIRDELDRNHNIHVNDKRVLRIDRALHIQSTIKYRKHGCTKSAASPEYIAKNYLNRQFHANAPNRKWLTDVTEFKYYIGPEIHKIYLSAILDLYDRRVVAYAVGNHNDNRLVFDTFDAAVAANPEAHPLFHSDRGFQYTSRSFHLKLQAARMKQSMSRVAQCIDNGPMEGFWGILKREMYYGYKFTSREQLIQAISNYIYFYNYQRLQRRLSVMTPMEFHEQYSKAA